MRLVNSFLSNDALHEKDIRFIASVFEEEYSLEISVQVYKYDDRRFYETDFDILDIVFNKETIYDEINRLIGLYEKILPSIDCSVEIIIANDDTETEILRYEKNADDISKIGLFITRRVIPNVPIYYSSKICNVYLNFDYVSFGVMF